MTEKAWAEKWEELCECLKWGKNTPVETILLQFHAVNQGNQDKKKKLEAVNNHLMTWKETHEDWQMGRMTLWKEGLVKILEGHSSDESGDKIE